MRYGLKSKPLTKQRLELVKGFDSGNGYLDSFLLNENDALDNGIGRSYIVLSEDSEQVIGYYNITTGCIDCFVDGHRYKCGGSVHINYLAVDKRFQKTILYENEDFKLYFSDYLLNDCIDRILSIRDMSVGFSFITLNATSEGRKLYERHGFLPLEEDMIYSLEESEKPKNDQECTCMYLWLDNE